MTSVVGLKFNRLLVMSYTPRSRTSGVAAMCNCRCDCGNETRVALKKLRAGFTKSCGCLKRENFHALITKHGMCKIPEYSVWIGMRDRCNNPENQNYAEYGGRGISVCLAWNGDFPTFYRDMGARPTALHTLERGDNDGNYEPGNVRWATREEQCNNTRRSKFVEYQGVRFTIGQLAKHLGTTRNILAYGLKIGLAPEQAAIRRLPAGRITPKRIHA